MAAKSCHVTKAIKDGNDSSVLYRNFKYHIVETHHYARLMECFLGTETVIGQVGGWRRQLLTEISKLWENRDERERGYRLFLALNLLKRINNTRKAGIFLRAINEITLEEVIFWVWQYHSYGTPALNAFNCIHMNSMNRGRTET